VFERPPATSALVAILPRRADLALARDQGWYRIPLRRAPAGAGAAILAFYLPACFGELRWAVRWAAEVRGIRTCARAELLPEQPRHPRAAELYLRYQLGPLRPLPAPIPSATLRRISFIPTTLGQLLRASDVRELWHPEDTAATEIWGAGLAGRSIHTAQEKGEK